jgi:antitoxin component YwqK of YwqJK toxin-antitoxin module
MAFTVWVSEFCVMHVKLQTIYEILEANRLADLFGIIKTLIIPRRSRVIDFLSEYIYDENGDYHGIRIIDFIREYIHDENGDYHGTTKGWYKNGQIRYEFNYKHGKKHGFFKGWWENKQIQYENNYFNGELHGIYREWYKNGQIMYERNYNHGRLNR